MVIVPDGISWQLPFGTLMRDGRFWIQDMAIAYVPSLAVLEATSHHSLEREEKTNEHSQPPRLFAMFNPAGEYYARNAQANGLGSLPDPSQPMRTLRAIYGKSGTEILSGQEASELRFKRTAGKYDDIT